MCVLKSDFLENLERARLNNVLSKICKNNNIHIKDLFNGLLSWENDKGFLKKTGNLPQQSVMVVTLSHDLFLSKIQTDEKTRFYYKDNGFGKTFTVPYVGVTNIGPLKRIAQGRFLRFSLARWWNPDSSFPEDRAYLQLSAIY